MKFRLYTVAELSNRSVADWLIQGLFRVGSLIGLYGPPAEGKSFVALDWALSIAAGSDWCGRSINQGEVVYVAAEGGGALWKRVQAWMNARGIHELPSAFFILEGVQVKDAADLDGVLTRIHERQLVPRLIVLDTLARCFVGGDENSASDMGEFIEGIALLQRETGASVLVLHHTGKAKKARDIERGSTAFRAACDVMIRVEKKGNRITVSNNKQKDDEEFDTVNLQLQTVAISSGADDAATSCVLLPTDDTVSPRHEVLPEYLRSTLAALQKAPGGMATRRDWLRRAGVKTRTLDSHRDVLVKTGYVEPAQKHGSFRVTLKGELALGHVASAEHLHFATDSNPPSDVAATAPTP